MNAQHRSSATTHESSAAGKWRAEYRDYQNGLPRSVRLVSSDRKRFDLRLNLSQVEVNTALGAEVTGVTLSEEQHKLSNERAKQRDELTRSALSGWALGSEDFVSELQQGTTRRLLPGKAGRPFKKSPN
mgnify:CR=1 FL=1